MSASCLYLNTPGTSNERIGPLVFISDTLMLYHLDTKYKDDLI